MLRPHVNSPSMKRPAYTGSMPIAREAWSSGEAYEAFMGRWSSRLALRFVRWLDLDPGAAWVDVGCGTGSLSAAIAELAAPRELVGIDSSEAYITHAAARLPDRTFLIGDALALPFEDGRFDAAVCGLVLNFVSEPAVAARELARVVRPGGTVAGYVWDYADGMEFLRHFWDAATELDARALELDEAARFPVARRGRLEHLLADAGLGEIRADVLSVPTVFSSFDDFWTPFLGGQGPASSYVLSLEAQHQAELARALRARLESAPDGSIRLEARALAVRGLLPS